MARGPFMAMATDLPHPTTTATMATPTAVLVTVASRMPFLTLASVMVTAMALVTTAGLIMPITGTVEILGGIAIGAAQAGQVADGAAPDGMAMAMLAFLAVGDLAVTAIDK